MHNALTANPSFNIRHHIIHTPNHLLHPAAKVRISLALLHDILVSDDIQVPA